MTGPGCLQAFMRFRKKHLICLCMVCVLRPKIFRVCAARRQTPLEAYTEREIDRDDMFHIIGVNHLFQSLKSGETPTPNHLFYTNCLNQAIVRLKPTLVAEEESRETLRGRTSIAEALALNFGVDHVLCDPEKARRKIIGYRGFSELKKRIDKQNRNISDRECEVRATAIEMTREFSKREDYWLDAIKEKDLSTTIFVCGDAHIDGFRRRLSDRGIQSEVLTREVGMNDEQRALIAEANLVLKANPDIDVV